MWAACAQREPSLFRSYLPACLSISFFRTHLSLLCFWPKTERRKKKRKGSGIVTCWRQTDWVQSLEAEEEKQYSNGDEEQWVQWANRPGPSHTWIIDQCDSEMTARGNRMALLWGGGAAGEGGSFCTFGFPVEICVLRMREAKGKRDELGRDWDSSLLREMELLDVAFMARRCRNPAAKTGNKTAKVEKKKGHFIGVAV